MIKDSLIYISKRVASGKAVKIGTRVLGRGLGFIGFAASGVSSIQMYRTFLKNDPYNEIIWPLQETLETEVRKWRDSVSCIGRKPYHIGEICTIDEGGAINALGTKELFNIPNTRYDSPGEKLEYHAEPIKKPKEEQPEKSQIKKLSRILEPSSYEAKKLIHKAADYIRTTEKVEGVNDFQTRKDQFIEHLVNVSHNIETDPKIGVDYSPVQKELSEIVQEINAMEYDVHKACMSTIKKEQRKRLKKRVKYAAIAIGSFAIGNVGNIKTKKAV